MKKKRMEKTETTNATDETATDETAILDGLIGDIRVGERYYVFTVSYAYIGVVKRISEYMLHLDDACIVMNAGAAENAVSTIVQGKANPEVYEWTGKPILIMRQSITCLIPSARPK